MSVSVLQAQGWKWGPCWAVNGHTMCTGKVLYPPRDITVEVACDNAFNPHRALHYPANPKGPT